MSRPVHDLTASAGGDARRASAAGAAEPGFLDPLEAIAARSVPPSTVDIGRAMVEGRHARRKRALGVVGGSATGLLALSLATVLAVGHGSPVSAHRAPLTVGSTLPHSASTDAPLPLNGADPFVVGARFGWLPDGVEQDSSYLTRGVLWLDANDFFENGGGANGRSETDVSLRTFAAGQTEQSSLASIVADDPYLSLIKATTITAQAQPPINGKPSYALSRMSPTAAGDETVALLWQMSNDRWAELTMSVSGAAGGSGSTTLSAEARHVAETVAPDATGVALPLSIAGLPSGSVISAYDFERENTSPTGWNADISVSVAGADLVYNEGPVGAVTPTTLGPSRCVTGNGLEACVSLPAAQHLPAQLAAGGLPALADDVTLRGLSPATWTTDVFAGPWSAAH